MIVIPAIDLIAGKCVRLYQGDFDQQTTYETDPIDQAREFQSAGFTRLHVVDLEGARSGSGQNRQVIRRLAEAVDLPIQMGGGVRTSEDILELFEFGVRYLILGTVALTDPQRVSRWVKRWGPAPFMISLDLKGKGLRSQGWEEGSGVELTEALDRIAGWEIPQVICTDVESDGTLKQPNYSTYEELQAQLPGDTTLIAAGGISRPEHVSRLREMGVDGAVVGRALYEGDMEWEELIHAG
jgi:phosphoribosylformimino-5-aminoimidazole carboxamide ribotide isomerase